MVGIRTGVKSPDAIKEYGVFAAAWIVEYQNRLPLGFTVALTELHFIGLPNPDELFFEGCKTDRWIHDTR
jgi:hypothetical protein